MRLAAIVATYSDHQEEVWRVLPERVVMQAAEAPRWSCDEMLLPGHRLGNAIRLMGWGLAHLINEQSVRLSELSGAPMPEKRLCVGPCRVYAPPKWKFKQKMYMAIRHIQFALLLKIKELESIFWDIFLCCTSIALFYVCVLLGLSMCCSNACFYVCRVVIAFVVERHRSNLYHASTRWWSCR